MKNILKITLFLILSFIGGKGFSQTTPSLLWATYFGGDSSTGGLGIVTDDSGNVYMTGLTYSAGLATSGVYKTLCDSINGDAFLAKFSPSGSLIWCTYYGGFYYDYGAAVAIDKLGNIYMAGVTYSSSGIATSGAYQTVGNTVNGEGFIAKFSYSGSLIWATYYGGSGGDCNSIVADTSGDIYLGGNTSSDSGIATSGAHQTSYAGDGDVFLAKFSSSGSLIWATYYGGSGGDDGGVGAIDKSGNIYLMGFTNSDSGIATSGTYQSYYKGTSGDNTFLAKFSPSGSLFWGTYYGEKSIGSYMANDIFGNLYVTGTTNATTGIATSGAYQTIGDSINSDAFLAKFSSSGSLLWATYYGGSGVEESEFVATDKYGNAYISGITNSTSGIATSGAYQSSYAGFNHSYDTYLAEFSLAGNLLSATYYGGYEDNYGGTIATDTFGNIYDAGLTYSPSGIATSGAYQSIYNNSGEGFLAKFSFSTLTGVEQINTQSANIDIYPNPFSAQATISYQLSNTANVRIEILNLEGETMSVLIDENQEMGNYTKTLMADNLASGLYIVRMVSDNQVITKKIIKL